MGGGQGQAQPLPVPQAPLPAPSPAPRPHRNPINSGIQAGMNAARESHGMDEEQRRMANASMMSTFASRISNPFSGSGLAGFNEAMSPAIQSYMESHEKARKENRENRKEDREDRRQNMLMNHQMGMLDRQNKMEERLMATGYRDSLHKINTDIFAIERNAKEYADRLSTKNSKWFGYGKQDEYEKAYNEYMADHAPDLAELRTQKKRLEQDAFGGNLGESASTPTPTTSTIANTPANYAKALQIAKNRGLPLTRG